MSIGLQLSTFNSCGFFKASSAILIVTALSACGGGGGGSTGGGGSGVPEDMDGTGVTNGTYTQINAAATGETLNFRKVAIVNDSAVNGSINGTLNAGRTTLTLAGNDTVTLSNPANTEYMRVFDGTIGGQNQFGVVGQVTDNSDVPQTGAGTVAYNGVVIMDVENDDGIYNLTGDARISVDWDGRDVDTRFDSLSGQFTGAGNNQTVGSVSGTIEVTGATLSNSSFSGGNLTTANGIFASNDTPTVDHKGQLFGPNADEVGGVLVLSADDLNVNAIFAAE